MTWAVTTADGVPVQLPHLVAYQRADNGATWHARVEVVTAGPEPRAPGLQRRNRGSLRVTYGPSPEGPWGPPYRGVDPAELGLCIVEAGS